MLVIEAADRGRARSLRSAGLGSGGAVGPSVPVKHARACHGALPEAQGDASDAASAAAGSVLVVTMCH